MQIVIDISEESYKATCKGSMLPPDVENVVQGIKNGIPLPKGHGNLVDFDRLCEEYWDGNYMEIHKDDLSNIKPIIEADRGAKNDNGRSNRL